MQPVLIIAMRCDAMRWLGASLLALVLGWAGLAKAADLDRLAETFYAFELAPQSVATPMALLVVALEIGASVSLIVPRWRRIGFGAAFVLGGTFLGFNLWKLISGADVPCTCFGPIYRMPTWLACAIDLVISFIAGTEILRMEHSRKSQTVLKEIG